MVQSMPQPTSFLSSSISVQNKPNMMTASQQLPLEKIKLFENKKERDTIDELGDLYGLIYAIEKLEKAYVKDDIQPDEYAKECTQLLAKFKALRQVIETNMLGGIEQFMVDYSLDCNSAKKRIQIGVPATVEHGSSTTDANKQYNKLVAEAVRKKLLIYTII